jgi:predicted heme/steroid binding protein
MKSVKAYLLFAVILCFILAACSTGAVAPSSSAPPASPSTTKTDAPAVVSPAVTATSGAQKTFTIQELSKYNGKNGNPAYIAVNGVVYDVTNIPQWKNGVHNGYTAGNDLTKQIKSSPHGESKLANAQVVGKLSV